MIHDPLPGHQELPAESLPRAQNFRAVRLPSLKYSRHWSDCLRAYRETLPAILLPAVHAESYGMAAALTVESADLVRILAWNHSDNPYDYTYLTRYEPILHQYIANTAQCHSAICRRLPVRTSDIQFIPHGVPVHTPAWGDRAEASNRIVASSATTASGETPIRIAFGGRMEQLVKRVFDFPKLAESLDRRGIRFEMCLAGDGPQADEIDSMCADIQRRFARPQNSIRRIPQLAPDRMHHLWQWADVSMLMSSHEGLSVAMLEAMSAGCVPIVTEVESGARDVIKHGENGLLFPIGDVERAADLIACVSRDASLQKTLSMNAQGAIRTHYSEDRMMTGLNRILDELPALPPRRWPLDRSPMPTSESTIDLSDTSGSTIPGDARFRTCDALDRIAESYEGPIAIFGVGNHTRALAQVWADSPVEIVGFIDDDPSQHNRTLWGWPVVSPSDVDALGANSVLISSWMHETAIWGRRREFESRGIRVHRIYSNSAEEAAHSPADHVVTDSTSTPPASDSIIRAAPVARGGADTKPSVDAVLTLLVWDAFEATSRLLASLSGGVASRADWRLFILDQGSNAPTRSLLRDFAKSHADRVHLECIAENIGYPAGHNHLHRLAAKTVESQYLVTLNSDLMFCEDDWLDHMIEFMNDHPLAGIAGPTGVVYQRTPPERLGWCRVATDAEASEGTYDSISGSLCIMRQSMIDEIGLFDEAFTPGYYEDTDLAFRAVAAGWQIAICTVDHRHHDLGEEKSTSRIKRDELAAKYGNFQKRNRDLFVARWLKQPAGDIPENASATTPVGRSAKPEASLTHAR